MKNILIFMLTLTLEMTFISVLTFIFPHITSDYPMAVILAILLAISISFSLVLLRINLNQIKKTTQDEKETQHLKEYTDNLEFEAYLDPMTGAENKRMWQKAEKRLNNAILQKTADFAVAVCDINGLKTINDTLGHNAGDQYIILSYRHICRIFRHSSVYRIGGDEFGVIIENEDLRDLDELLVRFYSEIDHLTSPHKNLPPLSIAIGVSHFDTKDISFANVFHRADEYMYIEKMETKKAVS